VCAAQIMQHKKNYNHTRIWWFSSGALSDNALQSPQRQSICSSWAVLCDKYTVPYVFKLLFNKELIQTVNTLNEAGEIIAIPLEPLSRHWVIHISKPGSQPCWQNAIERKNKWWTKVHMFRFRVSLPTAGFAELPLDVGALLWKTDHLVALPLPPPVP